MSDAEVSKSSHEPNATIVATILSFEVTSGIICNCDCVGVPSALFVVKQCGVDGLVEGSLVHDTLVLATSKVTGKKVARYAYCCDSKR